MDDVINLGDDDECILIEETTIVEQNSSQKVCETNFSLVDAVNKRHRSSAIPSRNELEDDMDELEKLINLQKKVSSSSSSSQNFEDVVVSSSETVAKKRKLTDTEKDNAKKERELKKEKIALEKDEKRNEVIRKRKEKEREKETRKIEREMSAAINSKCELYTFCHVGKHVFDTLPGLEAEIRMLYAERKIENQLKIEKDLGTRIEWRRKCVELREDEDGQSQRFEYSSTQDLFAIVVPATTLKDVISSNSLPHFIEEQRSGFRNGRCTMLIVSFGKLELVKKKLHNLAIEIFEKYRAQIIQLETLSELALFTAQYLRSLSRREKKRLESMNKDGSGGQSGRGHHKIQYQGEKGIVIGSRSEIVQDWWSKMLSTIDRLSNAQKRAILTLIPDPIVAINKYSKMDYSTAAKEIGELVAENGRRVGPAMAHKILTMLTDETGNAVVE
uniref:ERCC4 domain-containing protein n=1 Tax=Caenorhabditis japonica TaxID=281687 RepID=A0A8R1DN41_CAEJA